MRRAAVVAAVVAAVAVGVVAPARALGPLSVRHGLSAAAATRNAIDRQPDLWARGRHCAEDDIPSCWDALAMGNGTAGRGPVRMG